MDFSRQAPLLGAAQEAVAAATVTIVGVGGLGAPAAQMLARTGVAKLRLVDGDAVSATDLHRQFLYHKADIGAAKVKVAATALSEFCTVEAHDRWFEPTDAQGIVLDCTDEPGTRARVHEACQQAGVPLVWGAVEGWEGQWALVSPGGPCLRCLWPTPSDAPSCADVGIAGPVTATVAGHMARLVLQHLAGKDVSGRLHVMGDAGVESLVIPRRPTCACAVPK